MKPDALSTSLLALSSQTQLAYAVARQQGRHDLADELGRLGMTVAAMIAKALRGELLERVS